MRSEMRNLGEQVLCFVSRIVIECCAHVYMLFISSQYVYMQFILSYVCVYACVCVCVCVRVCVCACVCHMALYLYIYICVYTSTHECQFILSYVYAYTCVQASTCASARTCISTYIHTQNQMAKMTQDLCAVTAVVTQAC